MRDIARYRLDRFAKYNPLGLGGFGEIVEPGKGDSFYTTWGKLEIDNAYLNDLGLRAHVVMKYALQKVRCVLVGSDEPYKPSVTEHKCPHCAVGMWYENGLCTNPGCRWFGESEQGPDHISQLPPA